MQDKVTSSPPDDLRIDKTAPQRSRPTMDRELLSHAAGSIVVDQHFIIGDSIAAGVCRDLTPPLRDAGDGVAWLVSDDNRNVPTITSLTNRVFGIGGHSCAPLMARRLYELTGRRSLWTPICKGNTALLRAASVWGHWDMDYPEDPDNMLAKRQGNRDYGSILPASLALRDRFTCFSVQDVFVHLALGKTDAIALFKRTITQSEYSHAVLRVLDHFRARYGARKLFLWTSGRLGNSPDATARAESRKDMAGIRAAQRAAQDLSPDIHVTFDRAHETGSPYNSLAVDASGQWLSGFELQDDGVHYSQASYDCIAVTAAARIAEILGPRPTSGK